jgi:thioredoxin-like negative regulator of GroEL
MLGLSNPFPARLALLVVCIVVAAPGLHAQQNSPNNYSGISVEASPQVFATMCALDAAGFGADESTLAEMPTRLALRADLLKMQGPATKALRQFYRDHELADPGETLSRYMAFALVAGPPPDFQLQGDHDLLPPDVLAIDGFQEVLVNFYREANLGYRWKGIEPEYDRAIDRYESPLSTIVTLCNAYLREVLKSGNGRAFTVYVEPLVGNRTLFRNNGNHYSIVVGAGAQIPADQIQHAFLHFLLDSLVLQYRDALMKKSALLNLGARAPRLPDEYRSDFIAFTDECLIKAVELRLGRLSPEKLEEALKDADQSGFTMVRPLVAQLQKFEKSEPSMAYYFPDLIAGLDVEAEKKRLQNATFASADATPARGHGGASAGQAMDELHTWLAQGNRQIALHDVPGAMATFEKTLEHYPNQPQAVFGLAVASVLSGEEDEAEDLFEKLVAASSAADSQGSSQKIDPTIVAWSHVYLGRIHDLEEERGIAVNEYRAALAVDGAPESARVAAQRGVEAPYKPSAQGKDNAPQKP